MKREDRRQESNTYINGLFRPPSTQATMVSATAGGGGGTKIQTRMSTKAFSSKNLYTTPSWFDGILVPLYYNILKIIR